MQGQQLDKQKLQQNEELAQLRADTAIAKSEMSAEVKLTSDLMKARDVKTLKGPRSQYINNQEKNMTKDTFKQFVNKDGYAKGGVKVEVPSQNLELDPRSKSSIRGRNYVAQGDSVDVRGTKAIRKEKKPVKATWYQYVVIGS